MNVYTSAPALSFKPQAWKAGFSTHSEGPDRWIKFDRYYCTELLSCKQKNSTTLEKMLHKMHVFFSNHYYMPRNVTLSMYVLTTMLPGHILTSVWRHKITLQLWASIRNLYYLFFRVFVVVIVHYLSYWSLESICNWKGFLFISFQMLIFI